MGRQVNFYLHQDDQAEFDSMLRSRGEFIMVPFYHYTNIIVPAPDTIIRDLKKEGERVYLVRPEDFKYLRLEYFNYGGYWLIDEQAAPVLHFDRCAFEPNGIKRGRLYFQTYFVQDGQWRSHTPEFVKWADGFINLARRKLLKRQYISGKWKYKDYVGKNAMTWIQEKKPEINAEGMIVRI
jgi:hypothetical protein